MKNEFESQIGKSYLTFKEITELFKKRPPKKYLWSGIKEKSIGLCFGPSKSGKTIFCENLALYLATGRKTFSGLKLPGKPKKILFLGLEEYWEDRADRNLAQFSTLDKSEKILYEINYLYQPLDYMNLVITDSDWKKLEGTMLDTEAEVVFIDSITRMNHGNIEDSRVAQEIMQKLRNICHKLQITIICIHHTPKMGVRPITMDLIKGSAVFSQESDFALGINYTANETSYQKNVFFRHKSNNDSSNVIEFKINDKTCLDIIGISDEDAVLQQKDRRRNDNSRNVIIELVNSLQCDTIMTRKLINLIKISVGIKERRIKELLSELVKNKKIANPKKGYYGSVECINKTGSDEEE